MNTDKKWFSLKITTDARASEAIEFALNELEALGTEIDNLGKNPLPEKLEIVGYFNEKPDADFLQNQLDEALRIYGFEESAIEKQEWQEVENRDWLAEWKKGWKPTETAKFIIAPMWETIESDEKIVIRIEPSMAFGTGTHETTRLCLQAIEETYQGESFLDVGTGTGILAMAAAKIQTKSEKEKNKILACDTDKDSIKIAEENAEINETDEIEFYVGSITEETPNFDYVCANLTADVIIPILPLLVEKSNKTLVLSGILKEQEELVVSELRKFNIKNEEIKTDGEWISVTINN
jgi:ribosomal protein L11 methyltransferase